MIDVVEVTKEDVQKILRLAEGHFVDMKAVEIKPAKLTRTISAFANAEGGELFVGIDDLGAGRFAWRGFARPEDANSLVQTFEQVFPLGDGFSCVFLQSADYTGLVLKAEVHKGREVRHSSDGATFVRRGAQNLQVRTDEQKERLRRNKGLSSFETETVSADSTLITNSETIIDFMLQVVPTAEPETFLTKQQVLHQGKPTVAGLLLFADEPQAVLPKRSGIKVYRYKTTAQQGARETLDFDPVSVEGNAYSQIQEAVRRTAEIVESVRVNTSEGLEKIAYPLTALHEVITNAVIHRDYSIPDDIHIRIFDNRVEVVSPGTLPGHVTPDNILEERFARNGTIVRLINKFPDPPNKDVGEGLNTAFEAMREMKLKPPVITQVGGYVSVALRHEPLATPEELILKFLESNPQIANRQAREICFIGSENRMKGILQRMVRKGFIELVPGSTRYNAAYRRLPKK